MDQHHNIIIGFLDNNAVFIDIGGGQFLDDAAGVIRIFPYGADDDNLPAVNIGLNGGGKLCQNVFVSGCCNNHFEQSFSLE